MRPILMCKECTLIELAKETQRNNGLLMGHSRKGGSWIEYTSQNRVTLLVVDIEIWTSRRLVKLENHQLFESFMLYIREIIEMVTNKNC